MTNPDYTWLALVVDRSGSMEAIRGDAQGALRSLVAEQRALPGTLTVNLFQFDHEFDEVAEDHIDAWELIPRGSTALYDAIGRAMTTVGERLSALPEDGRPGKVVFVIITDGHENSSADWTLTLVRDLVRQQQDQYGWQVIFTAANLDAQAVGISLGSRNNMNFAHTGAGAAAAYGAVGQSVSSYRSGLSTSTEVPADAPQ